MRRNPTNNPMHVQSWLLYEKAMKDATVKFALDIGANLGGYTQTLLDNGFRVMAFEPVPQMFSKLNERFALEPRVELSNCMLGDSIRVLKNQIVLEAWSIGQDGQGGLCPTPNKEVSGEFDALMVTLDSCVHEPVGLIKLDTDGYELKVLRGGANTIRQFKPPILCELGCYLEKMGDKPKDFVNFVAELGYKIVNMDGSKEFKTWAEVEPHWPHHTTFDVVLMPR